MKKIIKSLIKNKNVLILGFGREGKSTLRVLIGVGGYESITVADARDVSEEIPDEVSCICGSVYMDNLDDYDVVFKSPGIVLPRSFDSYKCLITSQTEVFMKRYRDQIIGITGTKGKSTTASLLYHVLREARKEVLFGGNIGIPVFEIAEYVNPGTIIVLELSCHQLEFAKTSPHTAVLLNIYEDHLDHYGTRENYAKAKKNIFLHQKPDDILYTIKEAVPDPSEAPSEVVYVRRSDTPVKSFAELEGVRLKGNHNLLNAAFVYKITRKYKVRVQTFVDALTSFEPLPHRLQQVATINGVDYYDDSISTTVKSCISAVESIENAAVLLVGGMERNLEYRELAEYLAGSRLSLIICMYASGKRFFELYSGIADRERSPKAVYVDDLENAVAVAKENATEGQAVLLSPAAASYDHFKNFEDRGDRFTELVKNDLR